MTFYFLLFFVLIIIAFNYSNSKKAGIAIMFALLFFAAFRGDQVGTDTVNYLNGRGLNRSLFMEDLMNQPELIYVYLVYYIDYIGKSMRWIIIIFSIISIGCVVKAAQRVNANLVLVGFVFSCLFYLQMFNIARQLTADCILLLGYTYLLEDKKKSILIFLFSVLIATMFHVTSIIAIIVILLKRWTFKKNTLILIAIALFLLNIVAPIQYLNYISAYLADSAYEYYTDEVTTTSRTFVGFIVEFMKFIILMLIFKRNNADTKTNFQDNLFFFGVVVQFLTVNLGSNVGRIALVFTIFQILYIADYLYKNQIICQKIPYQCVLQFIMYSFVCITRPSVMVNLFHTVWSSAFIKDLCSNKNKI